MKKLIMFLTAAIVLCMTIAPAMATVHTAPGTEDGDVLARYVYTPAKNEYRAVPENGRYVITLPDGTIITVTPENTDGTLTLVIYMITQSDAEAYAWFKECMKEHGDNILPFDLYFLDADGNKA